MLCVFTTLIFIVLKCWTDVAEIINVSLEFFYEIPAENVCITVYWIFQQWISKQWNNVIDIQNPLDKHWIHQMRSGK